MIDPIKEGGGGGPGGRAAAWNSSRSKSTHSRPKFTQQCHCCDMVDTQSITTSDGVKLAYDSFGKAGPVVVLMHGEKLPDLLWFA